MRAYKTTSRQCTNSLRTPARGAAWPCPARRQVLVQAAKKGGDKKGGDKKGPKKSALAELLKKKEAAASAASGPSAVQAAQYDTPEMRMLAFQICDSYWRLTKKYLVEGVDFERLPGALFRAPFALLAHNRFQDGVTDPVYVYGNRAALRVFGYGWDELVGTPSRKSAADEPSAQEDRNGLLDKAAKTGVVQGFEVWRVTKSGRRFKIRDGTLFNVMDRDGTKVGQAAVFSCYEREDGTLAHITADPEADAVEEAAGGAVAIPTPEDMQAAEAAVAEQAAYVRSLKEEKGMSNQDIPVQIAVLELKKRKEKLAALKQALDYALAASMAAFDDEDE